MTDTPQHIKDLQLQLWLSKTPGERLHQFLMDNEAMLNGLREAKRKWAFRWVIWILPANTSRIK